MKLCIGILGFAGAELLRDTTFVETAVQPAEVAALGLKKAELTDENGVWAKLDAEHRTAIIELLRKKNTYADQSKSIDSYTLDIYAEDADTMDEENFQAIQHDALENFAKLKKGLKWDESQPVLLRVLGREEKEIPSEEIATAQEVPEPMELDITSTFPSAKYLASDMNNEVFNEALEQAAEYCEDLQDNYGDEVDVSVKVKAGESLVTPPKGMVVGDLARLRAQTAKQQAIHYFKERGIDISHVDFQEVTVIGTEPYDRQKNYKEVNDEKYTKEQFLKIEISLKGWPAPPPPPLPAIVTVVNVEPVFADISTSWNQRRSFEWPKIQISRQKRRQIKRTLKQFLKAFKTPRWLKRLLSGKSKKGKNWGSVACPKW